MNKRRTNRVNRVKKSISTFEVAFLLLTTLAIIAAGVNYAILRNEQVALDRETDQIYQGIKMHEAETMSEDLEIARKIGRFEVKSQLREYKSLMRERPDIVVERVNPVDLPVAHAGEMESDYPNLYFVSGMASVSR